MLSISLIMIFQKKILGVNDIIYEFFGEVQGKRRI